MKTFGDALKRLRNRAGMTQEELADAAGVSTSLIAKNEAAPAPQMKGSNLKRVAKALGFDTVALFEVAWRGDTLPVASHRGEQGKPLGIPIINKTPAGPAVDYEDVGHNHYDYLPIPTEWAGDANAFAVEVVGDSMLPELRPGDRVVCSPAAKIQDGDIVFVRFDGSGDSECCLKRVYSVDDDRVELRSDNTSHKPRVVNKEQIIRMARVVGHYRKM